MKVLLRDPDVLLTIRPLDVTVYLRNTGWQETESNGAWSVWVRNTEYGIAELMVPLDKLKRDYLLRISDVVNALEEVENRSSLAIVADLTNPSADIIRLPANYNSAADGTITIEDGIAFVSNIREMMLAGACSAIKPRPIHPTRKPNDAVSYVNRIRLGQTERGSYVFKIISNVAPRLTADQKTQGELFESTEHDPFERKVTTTLAKALEAMGHAAQRAASTGNIDPFDEAVALGLSANLCDAVVALAGKMDPSKGLPIRFTWSAARPIDVNVPTLVVLTDDMLPFIQEAGRVFREKLPEPDVEVRGYVVSLRRGESDPTGIVQIVDVDNPRGRKISVELFDTDYQRALDAHRDGKIVQCSGELRKQGRDYVLMNHSGIVLHSDDN